MIGTMRIIILSNNANCLISVRQEGPQDHPACGVRTTLYYTVLKQSGCFVRQWNPHFKITPLFLLETEVKMHAALKTLLLLIAFR